MKRRILISVFMLFCTGIVYPILDVCAKNQDSINGEWMLLRTVGKTMNIDECSDVFVFSTDGSYKIFNDCYGQNKKEPIVESGKWKVSESKIYFNDRKFTSNYTLYSVNKSVVLTITSLTADSLKINFNGNEQFFKKMKSRK